MADDKQRRISDALSALVSSLIPAVRGDSQEQAEERLEDALDRAQRILDE